MTTRIRKQPIKPVLNGHVSRENPDLTTKKIAIEYNSIISVSIFIIAL